MCKSKVCPHKKEVVKVGCWKEGSKSFAEAFPHLIKECDGWDPRCYASKSNYEMPWVCSKCGHRWPATLYVRATGHGCPECGKKKQGATYSAGRVKKNNLAEKFPKIARDAYGGWDPAKFSAGCATVQTWWCDICKKEYEMSIDKRTGRGDGCLTCAAAKRVKNFRASAALKNNLALNFPLVAADAIGWNPRQFAACSREVKAWWCNVCKKQYLQSIVVRTQNNCGCQDCAKKKRALSKRAYHVSRNNLASRFPHLANEAWGWNPARFSAGCNDLKKWKCSNCGKVFKQTIANRTCQDIGCRCGTLGGYDPAQPGYLYFLEMKSKRKFGITNKPRDRVYRRLKKAGFTPVQVVGPLKGDLVKASELTIKKALKAKSIPTGPDAFRKKFEGWTETFKYSILPANTLSELFALLGLEVPNFLAQ